MFHNETQNIILIIIILITSFDIQILAVNRQFNGNLYDFNNRFKGLRQNANKQDKIYGINRKLFDENENGRVQYIYEKQLQKSYKREDSYENYEEQGDKNSYQNLDLDGEGQSSDYKMFNYKPSKISYSSGEIYRREIPSIIARDLQNSSLYPSVLTKALEISLNTSAPIIPGESIFSSVAQKMNTSTLELAKKIAKSETLNNGDQFTKLVQNYLKNNGGHSQNTLALNLSPIESATKVLHPNSKQIFGSLDSDEPLESTTTTNLPAIFDRILYKLDSIENAKNSDDEEQPDGAPCDLIGSWSSTNLGFCFDIQLQKDKIRNVAPAEINNKILLISVSECTPTKRHEMIDLDWKFTGSALKERGGPFYIYGQKRMESVVTTFLGFCRTCGGIDTIFGSWNFLLPSKDCHDMSLCIEVKRDILRRVRMEMKRKERFKDLFYQSRGGKK